METKWQLNALYNKKIEGMLIRLRQEQFELGDKTGKFLANQLKQQTEKSIITSVADRSGKIAHDPLQINNIFRSFYSELYSSDQNISSEEIESFSRSYYLRQHNHK